MSDQLGPVIVVTAKDAQYYADACDAWESAENNDGDGDHYSDEELASKYAGLSRSAACDWAIYGQTVQGNLNLENIFIQQATYAEQMRLHVKFLNEIIERMYDLSEQVKTEATKTPEKPPKKWYQIFD